MQKVLDVYNFLNEKYTIENQEPWDNSGLIVGDYQNEVRKIAVVLDINDETLRQSIEQKADLIVSHHPLIFKPVKKVTSESIEYKLIKNNISVISIHTCYDNAKDGVNDILCEKLGIENTTVVETSDVVCPIVRMGTVNETTGDELAKKVKEILSGKVSLADAGNRIRNVAVCSGSGSDFIREMIENDVDAYITGEASYHDMLFAKDNGMSVISAGHYETEKPAMEVLKERIKERFNDIEILSVVENGPIIYF